jgi:hypothetical protein
VILRVKSEGRQFRTLYGGVPLVVTSQPDEYLDVHAEFLLSQPFAQHLEVVTNHRYICEVCGKETNSGSGLYLHKARVHKIKAS